jgi:hypothetical protein
MMGCRIQTGEEEEEEEEEEESRRVMWLRVHTDMQ